LVAITSLAACGPDAPPPAIPASPSVPAAARGRLPPVVIQRIVRAHVDVFRKCYEDGLRRDPNMRGKVVTRFVIGLDGSVTNRMNDHSSMPDGAVVSCVVRAFGDLHFPPPDGGIVTVTYPIQFSPEDPPPQTSGSP
jgi:hypothetical protein